MGANFIPIISTYAKKFHLNNSNNSNLFAFCREVIRYLSVHMEFKLNHNVYTEKQIEKIQEHLLYTIAAVKWKYYATSYW